MWLVADKAHNDMDGIGPHSSFHLGAGVQLGVSHHCSFVVSIPTLRKDEIMIVFMMAAQSIAVDNCREVVVHW